MTDEEILRRLSDLEDGWTERKEQGVSIEDVRKALVAFANSVPDGEEAILFIGVADKGEIKGVDNPEDRQKKLMKTAKEWCYPPINCTTRVLAVDSKHIIAFIVGASFNKPQFAGPAFTREGNESKKASDEQFKQLIASRNSKVRPLLEAMHKKETVTAFFWTHGRNNRHVGPATCSGCVILECNTHYAILQAKHERWSASYDQMTIKWNEVTKELQIDFE